MTHSGRRPLNSRNSGWARAVAEWLATTRLSPDRISQGSVVFAGVAGAALWATGSVDGPWRAVLLLLAAAACQLRLLCNLFDGMVAVEGDKSGPEGAYWNEAPDRVADLLILVGAGLGAGTAALGWAAAALAVLTAYVREFGRAEGAIPDFSGPMAKQHRMAVITGAALLAAAAPGWPVIEIALWIVTLGAAATAARRSLSLLRYLRHRG